MDTIGVVGMGFVGTAVNEGMKHAFKVKWHDKYKKPDNPDDTFCDSIEELLRECDGPIFVCVPTPMIINENLWGGDVGSCCTDIVRSVLAELNACAKKMVLNFRTETKPVIVIKSTVPPGTTEDCNNKYEHIQIVFNPEFLRESSFVADFKNQDRIIIGGPHDATAVVKQMYQTAYPSVQTTKTSSTIAEMVKYVTNCFLATKVSFANEIAELCGKLQIDYDKVIEYATKDQRLGISHWSVPGPDGFLGFGQKCFPKDLNALIFLAKKLGIDPKVMQAAWEKNLQVRSERDWEKIPGATIDKF